MRAADKVWTACSTEMGFSKTKDAPWDSRCLRPRRTADDDERYGVANGAVLQTFQETGSSAQIAVNDESVNLRLGQLGPGPVRFRFHVDSDVQTTEDAFENADFLKIAREHHG